MNVWTLKHCLPGEEDLFPSQAKELIQIGRGKLLAVPAYPSSDEFRSKHSPMRADVDWPRIIETYDRLPISYDLDLSFEIVRYPFIFRAYKLTDITDAFLFVWGGLDSPIAFYSLRWFAGPEFRAEKIEISFGKSLVRSLTQNNLSPSWDNALILFDPSVSPSPDDGGGFGDFGYFTTPDIEAVFSGEEPFSFEEFNKTEDLLEFDSDRPFGLWDKQLKKDIFQHPILFATPFIHPKDTIPPKRPAQTGDQDGFGNWHGFVATSSAIEDIRLAAFEACRPCHFFEKDGSFIRAKGHPNLVMWENKPHWSKTVSPDQLGRDGFKVHNGWYNHDDQHDQSICGSHVYAAVRKGADPSAILEAQMAAHRMMLRLTTKKGYQTSDPLTGRSMGRTFLQCAYLLECLPPVDLREFTDHLGKRLVIDIEHASKRFEDQGKVKYLRTIHNDRRIFRDGEGWIVWEDALAVMGLYALATALENLYSNLDAMVIGEELKGYAYKLATSIAEYGTDPRTGRIFAHVLIDEAMKDGIPDDWWLPVIDTPGNDKIHLDTGTDFTTWALPCFKVAELAGSERGKELCELHGYDKSNDWRRVRWMGI
jgi:hypothetical protein